MSTTNKREVMGFTITIEAYEYQFENDQQGKFVDVTMADNEGTQGVAGSRIQSSVQASIGTYSMLRHQLLQFP
jgi:hypothetical protein